MEKEWQLSEAIDTSSSILWIRQNSRVSNLSVQPLSPLDGRYRAAVADLGEYLSEAGLNRARIQVEIEWLIQLANRSLLGTDRPVLDSEAAELRKIVADFSDSDVRELGETEAVTKHDVKA
ncbi:MAG: hypothetical protein RJA45_390, partial [Actinomycetota bacterium]